MPGSPGGRATLLCPGAWLGRPLGLQACTAQGRAAGSQPGPPSCPPATMLSPRTRPRHSSLITTLIFSAPLSPRFSLERKHPAVAQALVTVQRGDTTCPFSKTCDFTARAGPRGAAGGWALLSAGAPGRRRPAPAQGAVGTAALGDSERPAAAPTTWREGAWGGTSQGAAPGSCTRRDSAGGPGGPCLTPRSTAHSRAGGGVPRTNRAHGSLTFGRAGPQPAHPQEDSRDRAGAGGRGASGAGGQGGAVGGVGGGAGPGPCS